VVEEEQEQEQGQEQEVEMESEMEMEIKNDVRKMEWMEEWDPEVADQQLDQLPPDLAHLEHEGQE
jgi:hypothetical protein